MRTLGALIALVATMASCGNCGGSRDETWTGSAVAAKPLDMSKLPDGLEVRLSNGKQGAPAIDRSTIAPATKLGDAETAALFANVAPIQTDAGDVQAFALRPASTPPPLAGEIVKTTFPPPPGSDRPPPTTTAAGPLKVLRWQPEGDVPIAPQLTVTFSEPMVAVTSQAAAAQTQPVKLVPTPKGQWRWIGTRTIVFDPEVRFPQATTYQVEISAGTKSATGSALAAPTKFTFETPTVTLVDKYPVRGDDRDRNRDRGYYGDRVSGSGPQPLDAPIFLHFDQQIDPRVLLRSIRASYVVKTKPSSGSAGSAAPEPTPITLRLVEGADLAALKTDAKGVGNRIANLDDAQTGRWLVVKPAQKLPTDARVTIALPVGTPSAEGPNKTKTEQKFEFDTYSAFAVERAFCVRGSHDICRPGMPLYVEFNNPIDVTKFEPKLVTVTPAIANMKAIVRDDYIELAGDTTPRTKYTITVGKDLTDGFAQKLGKDETHTVEVGDLYDELLGPSGTVVLDPAAQTPALEFFSANYSELDVQLYKITPEQYPAVAAFRRDPYADYRKLKTPPGTKLVDTKLPIAGGRNQLNPVKVELAKALDDNLGLVLAVVEPLPAGDRSSYKRIVLVESTRLAVDAHVDSNTLVAAVSELATGKVVPNATVELRPGTAKAITDANGVARLPLGPRVRDVEPHLIARLGKDVVLLEGRRWLKGNAPKWLEYYLTDDRKMYRPGEEVALKGWVRATAATTGADLTLPRTTRLPYTVYDSQDVKLTTGTATVSALGGFDAKFTLPKTPNLGWARVEFTTGIEDQVIEHAFQIEEFRRPEFEVTAKAPPGPHLVGGSAEITVDAKYFSGGPLAGAKTDWSITSTPTSFTPPNWDKFRFGTWASSWYSPPPDDKIPPREAARLTSVTDASGTHVLHIDFLGAKPEGPTSVSAQALVEDVNRQVWAASTSFIVHPSTTYVGMKPRKPFVKQGEPFEVELIGVDLDGKVVPGAKLEVKATRLDEEWKDGEWRPTEVEPQTCATTATAKDAVACTFQTPKGGRYKVAATITDTKGARNSTNLIVWVTGGMQKPSRSFGREKVELVADREEYAPGMTAEVMVQSPFFPADGILTYRRNGIVHTERITLDGPTKVVNVPITDAMVPNVAIAVDLAGTAERLDDNGRPDPKLPRRPAYATGVVNLSVPPKHRTLAVTVAPAADKLAPRDATTLALEVKDAAGKPMADAEVAVFVVDEAILSLSAGTFDNPIDSFYPSRSSGTRDTYTRAKVVLANPEATMRQHSTNNHFDDYSSGFDDSSLNGGFGFGRSGFGPGGGGTGWGTVGTGRYGTIGHGSGTGSGYGVGGGRGGMRGRAASVPTPDKAVSQAPSAPPPAPPPPPPGSGSVAPAPIAVRSNFNPLAAFAPAVRTDASGKATVSVTMPDNVTRYRIIALAAAGPTHFGKGESAMTVRLPLMVRPSAPRFLNFGDVFRLPIVLQNQTDAPMTVQLGVRTSNLSLLEGGGRTVTVPANERVEVQLPAAAQLAGTARAQIVATAGTLRDAAELEMPVWTPATTEAFATYGVVDNGAISQPVALPGQVVTQFGGIDITTASTNLQALTDALLYIVHYPFDCAEQRSSRMLAIASLRDVLTAFRVSKMPSAAALAASMAADIEQLRKLQDPDDGGFDFWPGYSHEDPYLTAYVTHALVRARAKGYAVPQTMLDRARGYLRDIDDHIDGDWPLSVKLSIRAFALYVRRELGERDADEARSIIEDAGGVAKLELELETAGWLLSAIAKDPALAKARAEILQLATNKVSETAGAANFTTSYSDGAHLILASDERVDAVMLEALIAEQPAHDLIPKLVTGLLGHRKRGRWLSTQENSFVLQALELYFRTYEKVTPSFVARVWLGNDYAGEATFRGRTTTTHQTSIAMADVAAHDKQSLVLQKDGAGRLYYRIGMTYAPANLAIDPADHGFVVERRYEAVDDPQHVTKQADGSWKIAAGARVRVLVTMVNEAERHHVALVDPLPAGLEAMNAALAVTGALPAKTDPTDRGRRYWWRRAWYDHQNLRDERVEAFAAELEPGVHVYEYFARATTPGTFVVPPPKAEEMYMPETFGRGKSDRVVVE